MPVGGTTVPHMSAAEFRARGREVIDWIASYMEGLERGDAGRPVLSQVAPGDVYRSMPEHAPQRAEAWSEILGDIDRVVMPGVTHWQSPDFFAYFPANASGPAILGDLLASGLGVNGFLWQTCPSITEVEMRVLDWLAEMTGLPEAFTSRGNRGPGGGVIQGTASDAALVAMVAARQRVVGDRVVDGLVAYSSSQAHSSIAKAAMVAGLGRDGVRAIGVDAQLAMRAEALEAAIRADRAAGGKPFLVCATVGTTSTGAVDPLGSIGAVCEREGLWLHVDAAYAGAAMVCPEHRWMIEGVERADSFNFNPHKWLLTNFDCSAMWVRDRASLIKALSISPEYLKNAASDAGAVVDYRDWQTPLGRRFRALKLWFVIRHYGVEGLRAHIREHVRLAELFEQLVAADARFEIVAPRRLGLVCFRLKSGDEPTRALMQRINASGEMFLTHSVGPVGPGGSDRLFLRMAIGGARTQERHVRAAWDALRREAGAT